MIVVYQKCLRPVLGNHCRFYPSCSEYSHEALRFYSVPKALLLICRRLLRCHPFCTGGYDPIKKGNQHGF